MNLSEMLMEVPRWHTQTFGSQYRPIFFSRMAVLPVVLLFLFSQRQFIQGIARSGIRG